MPDGNCCALQQKLLIDPTLSFTFVASSLSHNRAVTSFIDWVHLSGAIG